MKGSVVARRATARTEPAAVLPSGASRFAVVQESAEKPTAMARVGLGVGKLLGARNARGGVVCRRRRRFRGVGDSCGRRIGNPAQPATLPAETVHGAFLDVVAGGPRRRVACGREKRLGSALLGTVPRAVLARTGGGVARARRWV